MSETMRLGGLPEEILHKICCLLTNKEAIRLGLSSKEWWRLVSNRPTLSFSNDTPPLVEVRSTASLLIQKRYREEVNYMISTLIRYHKDNIDLETFTFKSHRCLRSLTSDLECIKLGATKKGLRNLHLKMSELYNNGFFFQRRRVRDPIYLLVSVFQVESLVELRLDVCCLQFQEGGIMWRNLKRLELYRVHFCSEGVFENITKESPSIEFLKIVMCCHKLNDSFHFKVVNLGKLKQLITELSSMRHTIEVINSPASKLELLHLGYPPCYGYKGILFSLKYVPEYRNLTSLWLRGDMRIHDSFFDELSQLEDLNISKNSKLMEINISCPSLKKIHLEDVNRLQDARFDVPNIALFEYNLNGCDRSTIPKLSFTGNGGGWISHITFALGSPAITKIDTWWFVGLNKFLTALNGSETFVYVDFEYRNDVRFNMLDADRMMMKDSTASAIREIYIKIRSSFACARAIVDGIFWICRPQTIKFDCRQLDKPKQLYDILMKSNELLVTRYAFKQLKRPRASRDIMTVTGIFHFTSLAYWEWERERERGRGLHAQFPLDTKELNIKSLSTIGFNLKWNSTKVMQKEKWYF